jgi:hypothetical protein
LAFEIVMPTATLSDAPPSPAHEVWKEIVRRQREATALAHAGAGAAAKALVHDELPRLIKQWGRLSGLPRNLQLLRLRKLIEGEIARPRPTRGLPEAPRPRPTPAPSVLRDPSPRSAPVAAAPGPSPSLRIPLQNISDMIDAVHLEEARARRGGGAPSLALAS